MKIHNFRTGFACNSSSTHSLVLLPSGSYNTDEDCQFGWDYFTAASKESKLNYLLLTIYENIKDQIGHDAAKLFAESLLGNEMSENGYIDHQSVYTLPRKGKFLDLEFLKELKEFILREDVLILGGNDNDEEEHKLESSVLWTLPLEQESHRLFVSRKDKTYNYWTIFDQSNGTKIRFSFGSDKEPDRAEAPELVDIKITDHCSLAGNICKVPCYQDSSVGGRHASMSDIYRIAYKLSELGVFEVALGGGETTEHPQFDEIVAIFKHHDIVPNFTTKSLKYIKSYATNALTRNTFDLVGAVAISVASFAELKQFHRELVKSQIPTTKINIQIIEGVVSDEQFYKIAEFCYKNRLRLTILGYKFVGRGAQIKPKTSNYLEQLKTLRKQYVCPMISVDTAFIASHHHALVKDFGVSIKLFTRFEGKFSCYIDAVAKTFAESSYTTSKIKALDLDNLASDFQNF